MQNIIKFIFLALKRKRTVEDYFKFQRFQAELLIKKLEKFGLGKAKKILDIGSGIGGFVFEIAEKHPNLEIYSLDKNILAFAAKQYAEKNIFPINADATSMPLKTESFDMVLASSVIEHVENQNGFIDGIKYVLRKNGLCYISFPPFYSIFGGHSISPFHYLPGNLPFIIYSKFYHQKYDSFKNYGLVKTTINSFENLIYRKFKIREVTPRVFTCLKLFLKIPVIREFISHHVEFFLNKC